MNERALVLGGGGGSGNAWMIGVIAGLFDAGLDVSEADLMVGTSAGSTAAAQISGAASPRLFADILSGAPHEQRGRGPIGTRQAPKRASANLMEITGEIIAAAEDAADMRRKMGAALIQIDEQLERVRQSQWRATVAARLPNQRWPQRNLLITAVDADSGEPVVLDRHSGVDLVDAIAASTAGGFAYRIGDKRYIDGGYRADVNADLAAGYRRVLIIPPLGERTRKPPEWRLHLSAQVEELCAGGSSVETILPDRDSEEAIGIGMNLMDPSRRQPSARAGYEQGKALAGKITKFWNRDQA